MNNAELIKALRWCGSEVERHEMCVDESCRCPYQTIHKTNGMCIDRMMIDAAAALKAADKRIAELEAQLPKEGEWIVDKKGYPEIICSLCGVHIPMVAGWCMDAHINYCPNCGARMRGEHDERTDKA